MTGRNYLSGFFKGEPLSRDREAPADVPARKATNITPIIEFVLEDPNKEEDFLDEKSHSISGINGPIIVSDPFYLDPFSNDSILRLKNTSKLSSISASGATTSVLVYRNIDGDLIPVGFSKRYGQPAFPIDPNDYQTVVVASLDETMVNSDGVWEVYRQYRDFNDLASFTVDWSNWEYNVYIADEIAEKNPVGEALHSGAQTFETSVFNTSGKKAIAAIQKIDRSCLSSTIDISIEAKVKITEPGKTIQLVLGVNQNGPTPNLDSQATFAQFNEVDADVDGVITKTLTTTITSAYESWDYLLYFRNFDLASYVDPGQAEFIEYTITYSENGY